MVTKDEIQRAIDVLKKEDMAGTTKNPQEGETVFHIPYNINWWLIEPVVKKHPELEEAFVLLAAASDSGDNLGHALRDALGNWDFQRRIDFYKNLPPDVLDTDPPLGVNALVRNWAERLFYMIDEETAQTQGVSQPLLEVFDHPPAVVSRHAHGRDMHRLFFGALVYPTLSDETMRRRVLTQVVDAAHNIVQNHETNPLKSLNALRFNTVAYPTEFLPIARALVSVSDYPVMTGIEIRYFWDLTGRKIFFRTVPEAEWVARLFESLFGEGLGALFESRHWDADSVRTVLRNGLQKMTDPKVYKPTLRELFKNGYGESLAALIESFGRVFPEQTGRFLWAVAHTVSSPKTALMFMEAATQKSLPEFVREWARAHIAYAYLRGCSWVRPDPKRGVVSNETMKQRGAVAKTLYSSMFGTNHSEAQWYTSQNWMTLWDGFQQLIIDPSRLMGNEKFMHKYRRALEENFRQQVCHDMGDRQRR